MFQNRKARITAFDLTRTGLFIQIGTTRLTQPGTILPTQRLHRKCHDHLISNQWMQIDSDAIVAIHIEIVSHPAFIRIPIARNAVGAQR